MRSTLTQYRPKSIESLPSSVSVLTEDVFYFIKIYTHDNKALFGEFANDHFQLNGFGQIAADEWVRSSRPYGSIELDEWLVLPDRLEGIVSIRAASSAKRYGTPRSKPRLLSSFVASYKAAAAKRINLIRNAPGSSVWQRSYQERCIPDDLVLGRARQLLLKQLPTNPMHRVSEN
ncbi:MAG: transposase [Leptolyngbya sp. SIO1D8]|nr:transposase [Leptolyngbya sp. SIO1D8]